jgi:hypothetical protein
MAAARDGTMMAKRSRVDREVFEVEGDLDRLAAEALTLELVRVAMGFGVDLTDIRIEPAAPRPRRSA